MNKLRENEFNYLSLVTTILQGKWIIIAITTITGLVGIYYSMTKPNSYTVVTPIASGKQSAFIDYLPVNSILNDNTLYLGEESLNDYLVNATSIFEMFLLEFNDYQEMALVLEKDNFVKNSVKDMSIQDKRKKMIQYAKSFVISKPRKILVDGIVTLQNGSLKFRWHDPYNGSRMFNEAILLTLSNVKSELIKNFNKLALSMDVSKQNKLEAIRDQIRAIEQTQDLRMSVRVKYLKEHADIAKELNIEKNILDSNALTNILDSNALTKSGIQSLLLPPPNVEHSMNKMNDFPYYMRGFKAINKEISLINNRTKEDQLLLADGFIDVKSNFLDIENDSSASQLRNFSRTVEQSNSQDWVQYDFALANIKSHKQSSLYILLSIILGLVLGMIYVIFSKNIGNIEIQKKN